MSDDQESHMDGFFELVRKEGKEERRQGKTDCGRVKCVEHKG